MEGGRLVYRLGGSQGNPALWIPYPRFPNGQEPIYYRRKTENQYREPDLMRSLPIHGRGSASNPANRFTELRVEREDWAHPDDPGPETRLFRDSSRSIITTNDSPDVGFDASVNPYRGCEHGCSYCMSGNTAILMGDGSLRVLADLRIGDEIYGTVRREHDRRYVKTRVLDHWESEKPAYRVTLGDGTRLVASGDHRFLTLRGWKHVTGSEEGAMRRPHLTMNDRLLGVGHTGDPPETAIGSDGFRRGYLCGMVRGDGFLATYEYHRPNDGGGSTQHQFRLALADRSTLDRTRAYFDEVATGTNRFLSRESTKSPRAVWAIRTHSRRHFQEITDLIRWPADPTREWMKGFLSGVFDAEGSYSGGNLRISNTDPTSLDFVRRAFSSLGFHAVLEPAKTRGRTLPLQTVRLTGGLKEHLRFFHAVAPSIRRRLDIQDHALNSQVDLSVQRIEPIGEMPLFDITTGTGDFIANGVVSHNCYARPNHEYLGLSAGLDFETKIFVKEDAPELLRKELASPSWKPKVLVMSGVTDPYQPAERRMEVTRGCLEVMAEARNPVSIITKSHLVTRDMDHLRELAAHDAARVTLSITTLRNEIHRAMEPRASVPKRRLRAIRELADEGISVGVNVAPVVPGLTEHEMADILEAAAEAGATRAGYIVLRLPFGVKDLFADWLEHHFPSRKDKIIHRLESLRGGKLNDPRFGSRMKGEGPYADQIRDLFQVTTRKLGLDREDRPLSTSAFRRPRVDGEQMALF